MMKTDLVLVPGLLCDDRLWLHQKEALEDRAHIHIGDISQDESISSMAARILAESPDHFSLAGLSMGGYVAFEIMRQAPQRVDRLALLNTSARADSKDQIERRRGLVRLAKTGTFKGVTPRLLPMLLHPDHLAIDAIAGTVINMAASVGKEAFIRQQTAILNRIDSRQTLGALDVDTLVICGREDMLTPVDVMQELADGINRAAFHVIEDCGHLSPLEQPRQVTDLMRDWLHGGAYTAG